MSKKVILVFLFLVFSFAVPKHVLAALTGDVNGDGKVDIVDIGIIIDNYAKTPLPNPKADVNHDGVVDIVDIGLTIDNYGKNSTNPTATPVVSIPPQSGNGVWISQAEIMQRPTSGAAWDSIISAAGGNWGTADVSNQDSNHDQLVLAGAYACARSGQFCDKTVAGLKAAIGTETGSGSRWLAVGRNMLGYTIAADVMRNSGHLTGTDLTSVSNRLANFLTEKLPDNNSGVPETLTPFNSGSNASAQEAAVYTAIARYTGNTQKLSYVWNRYRLYSCDKSSPETVINIDNGFAGGWSFAANKADACAVNPKGSTKNSHNIDGAVINDIVRGASFTWPPVPTQYVWTGFRGYLDAAVLLQRAGFPALSISDNAPLRDIQYICYLQNNTPGGWWNLSNPNPSAHLAHSVYGVTFPSGCGIKYPVGADMILGFTDWTHP